MLEDRDELESQLEPASWHIFEQWHPKIVAAKQSAFDSDQPFSLPSEVSSELFIELPALPNCGMAEEVLLFVLQSSMVYHGIDDRRATAVIALLFYDLLYLLRLKQLSQESFDYLRGFIRTMIKAMSGLRFRVVSDFDEFPLIEGKEDRRDFSAWMKVARKAAEPGSSIDGFEQVLESSYSLGFGAAKLAEPSPSVSV